MYKSIWVTPTTVEELNLWGKNSLLGHLGIVFTEMGSDFLTATMPVDHRTKQPLGILHGGASCVLAETVGNAAANYCVDIQHKTCVGLEINVNHIRSVQSGIVTAVAKPLHIGKMTQVWEIRIQNEAKQMVAISRLTVAVLNKKNPA